MNNFNFKSELIFILTWTAVLDIIVYFASIIFIGFTMSMIIGLLLGTIVLCIRLILLFNDVNKNVRIESKKQNPMMKGYLFRLLVTGFAIVISFKLDFVNTVGTILPLFYPKVIYTVHSIVKRR